MDYLDRSHPPLQVMSPGKLRTAAGILRDFVKDGQYRNEVIEYLREIAAEIDRELAK